MPRGCDPHRLLHRSIGAYYTAKVRQFGATPLGVDWSSGPAQMLRFVQLLKLCADPPAWSWNDAGCGYGALFGFMVERFAPRAIDYAGHDLSAPMIRHARRLWRGRAGAAFQVGHASARVADFSVGSGIFNIRLQHSDAEWTRHIARTLEDMRAASVRGLAVNFMKPAPGQDARGSGLYRTDPDPWVRHATRALGWAAEVVEGYGLSEFTLLLRSPGFCADRGR